MLRALPRTLQCGGTLQRIGARRASWRLGDAVHLDSARRCLAVASDGMLRMRVKTEVADFGKLAGGVLVRARGGQCTELDAVGDVAASNAVKAITIANSFAAQEGSAGVAFMPEMATDQGGTKILRFIVSPRPAGAEDLPTDFSRGGIFVPVGAKAGQGGNAASSGAGTAAENATVATVNTPTQLARTVMGQWLRFAAPELRASRRSAAAARAAEGGDAQARASSVATSRRDDAPFLVTMGPPALSRAVKALAFVCNDLHQEHLAGTPPFLVVPRFWQQRKKNPVTGKDKTSSAVVLWLARVTV